MSFFCLREGLAAAPHTLCWGVRTLRLFLLGLMVLLLLFSTAAMDAASAACRLFVTNVLPGLFPYMTLALMLSSRMGTRLSPGALMLLGWCGGSPAGARLLRQRQDLAPRPRIRLMVSCATMSPMFLLGTLGMWLHSRLAGGVLLVSHLLGGLLTGLAAERLSHPPANPASDSSTAPSSAPLSFGEAVDAASRTMLLVCGTMMLLRIAAAVCGLLLPAVALPLMTMLEVTSGAWEIALLPLPLPLRTALLAGATGFGGLALALQNRAVLGSQALPWPRALLWQIVHGLLSFLLALGLMLLCG